MSTSQTDTPTGIRYELSKLFSLSEDKASDADIDQALRSGIEMRGTNLWVLIFAIFVASIGLNVNSTAVIIGAMLISPLMGPIMGVGYGVGIYDFQLVRASLRNLFVAVIISLITSIVYFLISPLTQAQSELLARTTPTIWDVLIALFGGLAGIVGATRKEKSNVVPGVAIATALMPPLCTAGYGLANGNWAYFGGAFYLFTINSVFIALSSALIVRAFHVQEKQFIDEKTNARVKRTAFLVATLTVVPSIYLAYALVQDELFKSNAASFVNRYLASDRTYVTQLNIDPKLKVIEITVIGEYLTSARLARISEGLPAANLAAAQLKVHQQADREKIDVTTLRTGLLSDLYTQSQQALEKKDERIQVLQQKLEAQLELQQQAKRIPEELSALFPEVIEMWLSEGNHWQRGIGTGSERTTVLNLRVQRMLTKSEQQKIEQWFAARIQAKKIKLLVETNAPPKARSKPLP